MKALLTLTGMLFLLAGAHAQKKQHILIQFSSAETIPQAEYSVTAKRYIIHSADKEMNSIFSQYTITLFQKAYPHALQARHAKSDKLDRVYYIETAENAERLFQQLKSLKSSAITGPLYLVDPPDLLIMPNDYRLRTALFCDSINSGIQNDMINAPEAWDITTGDTLMSIAMIDVNFRRTHQELAGKIRQDHAVAYDPGWSEDHGTVTSSLASANTNNGKGIAAIGYNTRLDLYNLYTIGYLYDSMIVAAQNGARVINCSFLTSCSPVSYDQDAIDIIHDTYNTVIVAAAGNRNCGTTGYVYPASYDHVICVGGVGHRIDPTPYNLANCWSYKDLFVPYYANTNAARTTYNDKLDVCAFSVGPDIAKGAHDSAYTNFEFGTSLAAPMVSGTAALILSVNPNLTPEDVDAILKCTARDLYELPLNLPYLNQLGWGRINAGRAVRLAQTWPVNSACSQQATPTDIVWYEVLTDGTDTIEVENSCASTKYPSMYNIGYRLEVVAGNMSQRFKWLNFYLDNNVPVSNNIKYGTSIYLRRGLDYPFENSATGKLTVCVRVDDCIPSRYYSEDREADCFGDGHTYTCPSDITINGAYSTVSTESFTWIQSTAATTIDASTAVLLDAHPINGYVLISPADTSAYLESIPDADGEFVMQAVNGCGESSLKKRPVAKAIDKIIPPSEISVYPNPTKGIITVKHPPEVKMIWLIDLLGKPVATIRNDNASSTQIDMSRLPAGTYMLRMDLLQSGIKVIKY